MTKVDRQEGLLHPIGKEAPLDAYMDYLDPKPSTQKRPTNIYLRS